MKSPLQINEQSTPRWRRPLYLAWETVVVIVVFYLLREHLGHILGWWPYLLLLLCPVMHLFHGHGGHSADHNHSRPRNGH
jgi:fatty acid desaturase